MKRLREQDVWRAVRVLAWAVLMGLPTSQRLRSMAELSHKHAGNEREQEGLASHGAKASDQRIAALQYFCGNAGCCNGEP